MRLKQGLVNYGDGKWKVAKTYSDNKSCSIQAHKGRISGKAEISKNEIQSIAHQEITISN